MWAEAARLLGSTIGVSSGAWAMLGGTRLGPAGSPEPAWLSLGPGQGTWPACGTSGWPGWPRPGQGWPLQAAAGRGLAWHGRGWPSSGTAQESSISWGFGVFCMVLYLQCEIHQNSWNPISESKVYRICMDSFLFPGMLKVKYYLLYFTTSLQKIPPPYNSFSPTIPPISIPPIYYHSLTNYLFNIFKFKKIIQYLYCHNTHYYRVTGLKRD